MDPYVSAKFDMYVNVLEMYKYEYIFKEEKLCICNINQCISKENRSKKIISKENGPVFIIVLDEIKKKKLRCCIYHLLSTFLCSSSEKRWKKEFPRCNYANASSPMERKASATLVI